MFDWQGMPSSGSQNWYAQTPFDYTNGVSGNVITNVLKVTSLEEAIMKSNSRPSENVFFNQSKSEFYNVRVDVNGNKSWQTFTYAVAGSETTHDVPKEMFDNLVARIEAIENKLKEGVTNA